MFNSLHVSIVLLIYAVLAGGIVFFSKKLADYVDALDKKTKISGAFIGAVLLAAVTSLPELFTSISATILIPDGADLVIGNILGSNLFNLAIIGVALIFFFRLFAKNKIEYKTQYIVISACLAIYAIIAYGILAPKNAQPILGPINFLAILIFVAYGLAIFFQPKSKDDEDEDEEKEDPLKELTVKQVVIRFVIFAVLLVVTSIFITYATDAISAKLFNGDDTIAGAIFLAIATSLPELTSTFVLCKKGNFNAALGDISGSCLFNFLIIGLAEFMSFRTPLLRGYEPAYRSAIIMLICTVVVLLVLGAILLINNKAQKEKKGESKLRYAIYACSGAIIAAGYLVFLIISNI
ncbi:MAG: hypothetical protein MJZ37_05530 [Bacilli bacterium]|nr:hypothetical protein [Bacilli bacterium]